MDLGLGVATVSQRSGCFAQHISAVARISVIWGLYWGYIGIMEKKMETTI